MIVILTQLATTEIIKKIIDLIYHLTVRAVSCIQEYTCSLELHSFKFGSEEKAFFRDR